MLDTLPSEVLDVIVQYSTKHTPSCLSTVSRGTYSISVRTLYASIPELGIVCMTQCLRTLSRNRKLAHLVQSFSFRLPPHSNILLAFFILLSRALSNMNNLHALSLEVGIPMPLNFANQASYQLENLSCVILPGGSYPISQLLSSQPTIKELYIICPTGDVSTLGRETLPALKSLSTPNRLLPILLPYRLSRLSRLCIIKVMASPTEVLTLSASLAQTNPPESLELCLRVNFGRATPNALEYLGQAVQYITSLRLDTYGGPIGQEDLRVMFAPNPSSFPKLKTLTITSQLPTRPAYNRSIQTHMAHGFQAPTSQRPSHIPGVPAFLCDVMTFFTENLAGVYDPQDASFQTQSHAQSTALDALHDSSCHPDIIRAWHQAHPSLERVVFPTAVYVLKEMDGNTR
ncbi:unnamed protein product [Rhizoctonia solani]|uniref:Uncharacterized protein n=1 Tax=Rhizoctonia solani TaxID=456999 RepID=A0A8H3AKX6_9AGAM|nr:unnamed protein product [Rhizoctonia solani]